MKNLRSISYYARRERLRAVLTKSVGSRGVSTALEASNENSIITEGHQASLVERPPAEVSSTLPEVGAG